MDDSAELPLSNLRRRNSIATSVVPTRLSLPTVTAKPRHSSSFPIQNGSAASRPPPPTLDFVLISFKTSPPSSLSYTSLKDLIPSSISGAGINSPTAASAANSGYEISIRNRLVKQAAWAYLQPMSSSPSSDGAHFLSRLWVRLSAAQNPVTSCLGFISRHVIPTLTRAVARILRYLRVRTPT
ncbi:hypothetical protein PanWU01x14_082490 [Parasponia andersonii]|uniref:Uncharacterized protein n=1 Tax=Parasponia andersonii TaxID=3476 RepID=A0A2P5D9V3_PARAD|nr:hypothetical protein PanWU01x14_082490 [Parasponia andersonii]